MGQCGAPGGQEPGKCQSFRIEYLSASIVTANSFLLQASSNFSPTRISEMSLSAARRARANARKAEEAATTKWRQRRIAPSAAGKPPCLSVLLRGGRCSAGSVFRLENRRQPAHGSDFA